MVVLILIYIGKVYNDLIGFSRILDLIRGFQLILRDHGFDKRQFYKYIENRLYYGYI